MLLTTTQVAEKIGKSTNQVTRLAKKGLLPTANQPKPGLTKFFMKFDSKAVAEYMKSEKIRPATVITAASDSGGPSGIVSRLDRMEKKLDRLLAIWS